MVASPKYDIDVMVVGAGFGGVYTLYNLRKAGFNVKAFERGSDLGGTWHANVYPGARVDSNNPIYQFSDPELWGGWTWKEEFPDFSELQAYFQFIDKKWDLKKDITFNTEIVGAEFDEATRKWVVACDDGTTVRCCWLLMCIGFSAQRYVPPFKGLDTFKGQWYHTGAWPRSGVDLKGKKVAVIGTGASGVQVIQEIAPEVEHLTVYQRTPNLALPMEQRNLSEEEERKKKDGGEFSSTFASIRHTFAGMNFDWSPKAAAEDTPEQQKAFFEDLWAKGGFRFWVATYKDLFFDQSANDVAYKFWAEKTRARINDSKKRDILAPLKAPHPFGTKRPSLEQNYYEQFNRPNVDVIDISDDPIQEITETGVRTSQGVVDVDVLVVATGYDASTGSITRIDIKGTDGRSLKEQWKDGAKSFLGMTVPRYPNMFYMYGTQAPTAFANGPTCTEVQGEWLVQMMRDLREAGVTRAEASDEAADAYCAKLDQLWATTLFPAARSWYQGSNIPGKPVQALNWASGLPAYIDEITECQDNDYRGLVLSK